jgi:predicted glycosyltransferase involved in capsule biosynthesis
MIVVTCMGRLRHLKKTLPLMVRHDRVIVVDWCCPDKTAQWVRGLQDDRIDVVQIFRRQSFHKTAALNAGAARAARAERTATFYNDHLLFLDADTLIFDPDRFERWYRQALQNTSHFHVCLRPPGHVKPWMLTGVLLCTLAHFQQVGGFDERIRGWGAEDIEMRLRLAVLHHIPWRAIPEGIFGAIEHSDASRTSFYHEKDKGRSNTRNSIYVMRKAQTWMGKRWTELDRKYLPLLSMKEPAP